MSYIIVWRNNHRDPHLEIDSHRFLETYTTYGDAENEAERRISEEGKDSPYHDYQIYEEATG